MACDPSIALLPGCYNNKAVFSPTKFGPSDLNYSKMQKPQKNNDLLLVTSYSTPCVKYLQRNIFLEELVHVYAVPRSIFEAQMTDLLTAGRTVK